MVTTWDDQTILWLDMPSLLFALFMEELNVGLKCKVKGINSSYLLIDYLREMLMYGSQYLEFFISNCKLSSRSTTLFLFRKKQKSNPFIELEFVACQKAERFLKTVNLI